MFKKHGRSWSMFRVALAVCCAASAKASAQGIDPAQYAELDYRFIGPEGNRVISVAGIPGDPRIYYAGAASGGIFKSTDGGTHWEPIFDDQSVSSIGSLAVALSDPNVIWAGTGETSIRSNVSIGNGIYKSTDSGAAWQHMGLEATGRIGRVIIHPTNQMWSMLRHRDIATVLNKNEECIEPGTVVGRGNGSCLWMRTAVLQTLRWTPPTLGSCLLVCGHLRSRPGGLQAETLAVASGSHEMAVIPGLNLPVQ